MAKKVNITAGDGFYKNTNFQLDFMVEKDGAPDNIAGWNMSCLIKKRATDADASAVLTKTTAAGGILVIDGPTGHGRVQFAPADTVNLAAGFYFYEIKRTDTGLQTVIVPGKNAPAASLHLLPALHKGS